MSVSFSKMKRASDGQTLEIINQVGVFDIDIWI